MKASELRIGNLVYNENGQIVSVSATRIVLYDDKRVKYKPILLTEEWLLKFGFEKEGDDLILDTDLFLLVSYNDDEFVHLKSNYLEKIVSIKHAHQLQNLYFALTGEELTLSE